MEKTQTSIITPNMLMGTNDITQVLATRTIVFNKIFTREYCQEISELLNTIRQYDELLKTPKEELYIKINICSEGGSIFALLLVLETIESLKEKGYAIHTHCTGMGASSAFILFASGTYRTLSEFTYLLNHQGASMIDGTIKEKEIDLKLSKKLEEQLNDYLRKNTDMTEEEIQLPYLTNTDIWYNAEEAVAKGIAHKIINL